MKTLATRIIAGAKEQEKVIALENCFHTWDDSEVTIQSMVDGIGDRLRHLGYSTPVAIEINRMSVKEVCMVIPLAGNGAVVRAGKRDHVAVYANKYVLHDRGTVSLGRLFNDEEQGVIRKTLLDFYHSDWN